MIINVTYGGNAPGAARYIQGAAKEHGRDVPGTEDRAKLLGGQGFGFPLETRDDVALALDVLRRDVELQASNTKPVENTVIHASMSWPQGYEPSREEMREASEHLAKVWGMEAHRRISWSHEETEHRHIHTLFGSIHPDTGYAHHDHELNDRAQRAAIEWERKHGIPPTRQKDHDKAAAAEASDHARTFELSKNTDGSILRRSLDRALSLGGHFGPDKIAQRKEFIEQNDLTKFPQHTEPAYAPPEVAREKRDYIRDNRAASAGLARAYDREAKERARGVAGLYEDHGFEKTSKPPVQEERKVNVGLTNDVLDWPWKKLGVKKFTDKVQDWRDERRYRGVEVQRQGDTTVYPDWFNKREIERHKDYEKRSAEHNRDFGKEVEEKGWDDPGVKRQWEKKYGRTRAEREEKREPTFPRPTQEKDHMPKPAPDRPQPSTPEEQRLKKEKEYEDDRVKNWRTQRERNGNPTMPGETPPWRKDERRTEQWRQQKEDERDERNSRPMPKLNPGKDQIYRPQQSNETPSQQQQAQESTLSKMRKEWDGYRDQGRVSDHERPEPQGREPPALPRPREVPMPKIEPRDHAPQAREERFYNPFSMAGRLDEIAKAKLDKERENLTPEQRKERDALTPEQKQANQDRNIEEFGKEWRRLAKEEREGRAQVFPHEEPAPMPQKPRVPDHGDLDRDAADWARANGREPSEETIERMNKDAIEREERKLPPHRRSFEPEESRADGTAGQGRQDRTEAGKPGVLPGGSHEHGSPSEQFRRQLEDSLRDIKSPKREIGKDRERGR